MDSPLLYVIYTETVLFAFDLLCHLTYAGGSGVLQYWHIGGTSTEKLKFCGWNTFLAAKDSTMSP